MKKLSPFEVLTIVNLLMPQGAAFISNGENTWPINQWKRHIEKHKAWELPFHAGEMVRFSSLGGGELTFKF